MEPVPVVPLFGPLAPAVANARDDQRPAGHAPIALYARGGSAPELIVVTRAGAGELRFASWALRPTEDPGRAESAPRTLARGAAGAVDVGTARAETVFCGQEDAVRVARPGGHARLTYVGDVLKSDRVKGHLSRATQGRP